MGDLVSFPVSVENNFGFRRGRQFSGMVVPTFRFCHIDRREVGYVQSHVIVDCALYVGFFQLGGGAAVNRIAGVLEEGVRDYFGTIGAAGDGLRDLSEERNALGSILGAIDLGLVPLLGREEFSQEENGIPAVRGAGDHEIEILVVGVPRELFHVGEER